MNRMRLSRADLCHALPGLTATQAGILLELHEANGRYVGEDRLLVTVENVTGNREATWSVSSALKSLRKVLKAHNAGTIECRTRIGWRLIWSPEWSLKMQEDKGPPQVKTTTMTVARNDDTILLITEMNGEPFSNLRMTRPQAVELARKLIHLAK